MSGAMPSENLLRPSSCLPLKKHVLTKKKLARSWCCMTSKNTLTDWWFQLFQTVFVIGDHYPKHADLKTSHQSPAHRNSSSPAPAISMVMFHHAKVDMKRKQNQACDQDLQQGDFTNKRWISPYLPNKHGQFHRENHGEPSIWINKKNMNINNMTRLIINIMIMIMIMIMIALMCICIYIRI